jgi:cytochrome c553
LVAASAVALAPLPAFADATEIASTLCAACHGESGNSQMAMFPRLAGQQPDYTAKQLTEFLSGKRKNEIMAPVLANIKADDVAGLAAYFAAQKPHKGEPQDAALAAVGKKLFEDGNTDSGVPACVGCHQAGGLGNERYPRLAGQHAAYVVQQITNFKAGVRTNDKGRVMRSVAERLTPQEMAAVAEYVSGL